MRDALQVPEHSAPRQVPDPDEPERRPKPVAFLMPLARMTLILPASATLPEACTIGLETWPLLMPIETVWPSPHSLLEDAMWTLHVPSNELPAAARVANGEARAMARLVAMRAWLKRPMSRLFCVFRCRDSGRSADSRL